MHIICTIVLILCSYRSIYAAGFHFRNENQNDKKIEENNQETIADAIECSLLSDEFNCISTIWFSNNIVYSCIWQNKQCLNSLNTICSSFTSSTLCKSHQHCQWFSSLHECMYISATDSTSHLSRDLLNKSPSNDITSSVTATITSPCESINSFNNQTDRDSTIPCNTNNDTNTPTHLSTDEPTKSPSLSPITNDPTSPSSVPTPLPSFYPGIEITAEPTKQPERVPTRRGQKSPTKKPSKRPTPYPTPRPTKSRTTKPSHKRILQSRVALDMICLTPASGCIGISPNLCGNYSGCILGTDQVCRTRDKCDDFDCGIRQLALQFAETVLPRCNFLYPRVTGQSSCDEELRDIFDALELNGRCGMVLVLADVEAEEPGDDGGDQMNSNPNPDRRLTEMNEQDPVNAIKIYASIDDGSDNYGDGTIKKPYRTIERAILASRKHPGSPRIVIVRAGTYYLKNGPIQLTSSDSLLKIQAYNNERVIVSGGVELTDIVWSNATIGLQKNQVKVADVSSYKSILGPLSSFFFNGKPATRAKHPNSDPWTQGLFTKSAGTGYFDVNPLTKWGRAYTRTPSKTVKYPNIRDGSAMYGSFSLGYGGYSDIFSPPASYWAVQNPVAGGGCIFEVPRSVNMLPSQFKGINGANSAFSHPEDAYVHAYHPYKWGNWIFKVGSQDGSWLNFERGGFQEARGSCGENGAEWFIENMIELLDSPNEFFLDTREWKLYFMPNGTTNDFPTQSVIATVSRRIIEIKGTADAPVKQVSINGFRFEKTYATHMDAHEVPSAGDWSITRNGAIFIEGGEDITIENNSFLYLGGNGVFISNYARNVKVIGNKFKYLGATAILAVGNPRYDTDTPWDMSRDPNHPFNTLVEGNIASEMGNIVKQSSGFFQALSAKTSVRKNIFFNVERSAINFNDGYGGANVCEQNLLFNTVRSTLDHGPFNSWDRQAYIQPTIFNLVQNGNNPEPSFVRNNFLIGGYGGTKGIDHDDGSSFYANSNNLIVYGYQKLKGRDISSQNNIVIFPYDYAVHISELTTGNQGADMEWFNNRVVLRSNAQVYGLIYPDACVPKNFDTKGNKIYLPMPFQANCRDQPSQDWKEWGKMHDSGSSIQYNLPSNSDLLGWCYQIIGIAQ